MSPTPRLSRLAPPSRVWVATGVLVLALCAVLAAVPGSSAAFVGRVVNPTNTVGINPYYTCQEAVRKSGAYFAHPFDDIPPTTARARATRR